MTVNQSAVRTIKSPKHYLSSLNGILLLNKQHSYYVHILSEAGLTSGYRAANNYCREDFLKGNNKYKKFHVKHHTFYSRRLKATQRINTGALSSGGEKRKASNCGIGEVIISGARNN